MRASKSNIYDFQGMKHHGKIEIEWREDGHLYWHFEGNAWPRAIECILEAVSKEIMISEV